MGSLLVRLTPKQLIQIPPVSNNMSDLYAQWVISHALLLCDDIFKHSFQNNTRVSTVWTQIKPNKCRP